ncbi:MAG TPA: carboxymuconolactone decarboxylase family protein [Burkholderiaceae bacterium]|nr:carboxymuconolactone decarboxylase family protein [Burkholderiaceae bacterium]
MSRIPAIDPKTASGAAKPLLDAVQSALGVTPNLFRVLAQSPKALEGFLGLYGAAAGFTLDKATQERIALAVAESNACDYCLAAHTAIGRGAGLSSEEVRLNRRGTSADSRAAAFVALAKAVNDKVGAVSEAEFDAARASGISDAEMVEVVAAVAINVFTNALNKLARTDIDFPRVAPLAALRAA